MLNTISGGKNGKENRKHSKYDKWDIVSTATPASTTTTASTATPDKRSEISTNNTSTMGTSIQSHNKNNSLKSTNIPVEINLLKYSSYVNIRGLKPITVQSKVPLISDLLLGKDQLFFALSETWLREQNDAGLNIQGYQLYRSDKKAPKKKFGRSSGGVAIYIRNDIVATFHVTTQFSNDAVELLVVASKIQKMIIACVYRQPENDTNKSTATRMQEALNKLEKRIQISPFYNCIICGGFNLPHIKWTCAESHITAG